MNNRNRGFVGIVALVIAALLIGGGTYVYTQSGEKRVSENPENKEAIATSITETSFDTSAPSVQNSLLPIQTPNDEYLTPEEAARIKGSPLSRVDLEVGDVWGDFVVVPNTPGGPSHMNFVGTTTVIGTFGELEGMLEGAFCFNVDPVDAHKIPRPRGDDRNPWFCFSNDADAKRALSSRSGKVTVRIANYWLLTAHIGGVDEADFVSLVQ